MGRVGQDRPAPEQPHCWGWDARAVGRHVPTAFGAKRLKPVCLLSFVSTSTRRGSRSEPPVAVRHQPGKGEAVIDRTEKDLLISELQLAAVAAKLNRAKEQLDGRSEVRRLDECVRHVVEAANLVDELLDSKRR